MHVIQIGPFTIDGLLLLCVLAFALAMVWAIYQDKKHKQRVEPLFWYALLFSLLVGRLVFVGQFWSAYQKNPTEIINIRDGGFSWLGALLAYALAMGFVWLRRRGLWGRFMQLTMVWVVVIGLGLLWLQPWKSPTQNWFASPHLRMLQPLAPDKVQHQQLDHYAGQPAVINLWATWCPPCRREMPVLQAAQEQYPDVHFIFVNQGERAAEITAYLGDQKLQLDNLWLDPQALSGQLIDSKGLPSTLFLNEKGEIVSTRLGELSAATLQSHLDAIRIQK